jgi:hypothetical protein
MIFRVQITFIGLISIKFTITANRIRRIYLFLTSKASTECTMAKWQIARSSKDPRCSALPPPFSTRFSAATPSSVFLSNAASQDRRFSTVKLHSGSPSVEDEQDALVPDGFDLALPIFAASDRSQKLHPDTTV